MNNGVAILIVVFVLSLFVITLARGRLRTLIGTWDRWEDPLGYWAALGGSAIGFGILVWQYLTH